VHVNGFDALDTSGLTVKKSHGNDKTPTRVAPLVRIGHAKNDDSI